MSSVLFYFYYFLIGFVIVSVSIVGDRLRSDSVSEPFDTEIDTGFAIIGILVWPLLVMWGGVMLVCVGMRWYLRWLRHFSLNR